MKTHEVHSIIAACLFVSILLALTVYHAGSITPEARAQAVGVCGDSVVDSGETCDDGNTASCDGCSSTCQTEFGTPPGCGVTSPSGPRCGDGQVDFASGELCDNGSSNGPCERCSDQCKIQETLPANCGPAGQGEPEGDTNKCTEDNIRDLIQQFLFSIFSTTVPTTDIAATMKEAFEDCVTWIKSGAALEQMVDKGVESITTGGPGGGPKTIRNINLTLQQTADNTFEAFFQSGQLSRVPSYFREDLIFQTLSDYNRQFDFGGSLTSTLDEDLYDIDAFVAGDFRQGGWQTWFKLTQEPQNNPYGARLLVEEHLDNLIASQVQEKQTEINIGRGFLSDRVCETIEGIPAPDGALPVVCNISTLGSVTNDLLVKTLGVGIDKTVAADELNEPLSKLHEGLITQVLSGDRGLLGVGDFIGKSSEFSSSAIRDIGRPGSGAGGGPDWACMHDFGAEAASEIAVSNLDDFVATTEGDKFPRDARQRINAEPRKFYERATIEFDLYINQMLNRSIGRFDRVLTFMRDRVQGTYAGYLSVSIQQRNNVFMEVHGLTGVTGPATDWDEQETHHVKVVIDAVEGTATTEVWGEGNEYLGKTVLASSPEGTDIIDTGDGLYVYFPEFLGWRYENIVVTLEPGGPHNGGARGPCIGSNNSGSPLNQR